MKIMTVVNNTVKVILILLVMSAKKTVWCTIHMQHTACTENRLTCRKESIVSKWVWSVGGVRQLFFHLC